MFSRSLSDCLRSVGEKAMNPCVEFISNTVVIQFMYEVNVAHFVKGFTEIWIPAAMLLVTIRQQIQEAETHRIICCKSHVGADTGCCCYQHDVISMFHNVAYDNMFH